MKLKKKPKILGSKLAGDIQNFVNALNRHGFYVNAGEAIKTLKETSEYKLTNVEIITTAKELRHLRPNGIKNIRIRISSECKAQFEDSEENNVNNPFEVLKFRAIVLGDDHYQTGFHVDLIKPEELNSTFAHPTYHIQFAPTLDREEEFYEEDWTAKNNYPLLVCDSPRIPHPPLDFILGFDFILHNFAPDKRKELAKDGTYTGIIDRYQNYIWKPYYQQTANFWQNIGKEYATDDVWSPKNLLPQLAF